MWSVAEWLGASAPQEPLPSGDGLHVARVGSMDMGLCPSGNCAANSGELVGTWQQRVLRLREGSPATTDGCVGVCRLQDVLSHSTVACCTCTMYGLDLIVCV